MATIIKNKNPRKPYTVRYHLDGRQRERSFRTSKEANDFKARFDYQSREQTFVDPRLGGERFKAAAGRWLSQHPGSPRTRDLYGSVLNTHVLPALGDRTIRAVAADRSAVSELLYVTMPAAGVGPSMANTAYRVITSVIAEAIKSRKIASSALGGIKLPAVPARADFVFPSHAQLAAMAAELPENLRLPVWLMRGCGLRIGEALAVKSSDFTVAGHLRITEQLRANGAYGPLKHRKPGEHRDVPVPAYVSAMLPEVLSGEKLFPGITQDKFRRAFNDARDKAGISPTFTPHSLRHVFASVALANGIPITSVSRWLGHASIQTTYGIYGHLVPESFEKAREVLDQEFVQWQSTRK